MMASTSQRCVQLIVSRDSHLMSSTMRSAPVLSPATAQHLISAFAHPPLPPMDSQSSASDSPDSLYSAGSPTFPDNHFEYDAFDVREVEVDAEDDEGQYEEAASSFGSPGWGAWPENRGGEPGWSPSPASSKRGSQSAASAGRKASIISLSPRGSQASLAMARKGSNFSATGSIGSHASRRNSLGMAKFALDGHRRDSNPSLLGFDLASQRRRSSTRSLTSARRRSSVLSNGSVMDPAEDARLLQVAAMSELSRRFSEVVEVTCPSSEEEDEYEAGDHTAVARARMAQWSPYSTDSDLSEVHTAPYQPTPEVNRGIVPTVLSNFPLYSVAHEPEDDIGSSASSAISPSRSPSPSPIPSRQRLMESAHQPMYTPPAPPAPRQMLWQTMRTRPAYGRAVSDYQFPPKTSALAGVPPGASMPRPMLRRSVSQPFPASRAEPKRVLPEPKAFVSGSFPLARPTPLGQSRLRESTRRQSVVSDFGDSRRTSAAGSLRGSISQSQASRRASAEASRRSSQAAALAGSRRDSRKGSVTSLRRGSAADRRASLASRKSSVVSVSEYGYLGPQIVIDAPVSATLAANIDNTAATIPRLMRANAPASIVLPSFSFPATAPNTPLSTPRYNPLDSFFGKTNPGPLTPSTSTLTSSPSTPKSKFPWSPSQSENEKTPQMPILARSGSSRSIMDRGRPISPPQFLDSFPISPRPKPPVGSQSQEHSPVQAVKEHPASPLRQPVLPPVEEPPSPKSVSTSPQVPQHPAIRPALPTSSPASSPRSVSRKAVPTLGAEELGQLIASANTNTTGAPLYERRGATQFYGPSILQHHRTVSDERPGVSGIPFSHAHSRPLPQRPGMGRRQATLPPELDRAPAMAPHQALLSMARPTPSRQNSTPISQQTLRSKPSRQSSVMFADHATTIPDGPPAVTRSTSSTFSRFFHKSKSSSISSPVKSAHADLRSSLKPPLQRPTSMDGSGSVASDCSSGEGARSSGSDRTLVEARDILKRVGGSPRVIGM